MGEIEGRTVLKHHGPSHPTGFGRNERFESSLVTAETGGRAWPVVHKNCLPFIFAQRIILKVTYSNSTWKIWKNDVWYSSVLQFSSKIFLQLGVHCKPKNAIISATFLHTLLIRMPSYTQLHTRTDCGYGCEHISTKRICHNWSYF